MNGKVLSTFYEFRNLLYNW